MDRRPRTGDHRLASTIRPSSSVFGPRSIVYGPSSMVHRPWSVFAVEGRAIMRPSPDRGGSYLYRERGVAPGSDALQVPAALDIDLFVEKFRPLVFWQMMTLGVIALGTGGLFAARTAELIPTAGVTPSIAMWVGGCLMVSALIF